MYVLTTVVCWSRSWNYGQFASSPTGHVAYWSFRLRDISPTTWTIRLL